MLYRITMSSAWSSITRVYEARDVKEARQKAKKTLQPDEYISRVVGEDGREY